MALTASDWVAGYAAVAATGALFLEIRRWFESGARLSISTMPEAQFVSSGGSPNRYIVVNVSNLGDLGTTITHLVIAYYGTWWHRFRRRPQKQFVVLDPSPPGGSQRLPYVLEPGHHWTGLALHNDEIRRLLETGDVWVQVTASHKDTPTFARVRKPTSPPEGEPLT
jgi:hypothetical protein